MTLSMLKRSRVFGVAMAAALSLAIALPLFLSTSFAQAQNNEPLTADQFFGEAVDGDSFAGAAGLGNADLTELIAAGIRVILGFIGIIAVVIILAGGLKWMTAAGNDTKVGEAKKLIVSGIIGLIITLSAYAIASFVISQLTAVTGQV